MANDLAALVTAQLEQFGSDVLTAIPRLLSGLVFLTVAYVVIRLAKLLLRHSLERVYPPDQTLIVDFTVLVVTIFMWFGVGLTLLSLVGLGGLAASLGTAVGFITLGVSYALSEMIEDTVAGIYLLRDPDFNPGDTVQAASTTGEVVDIGLRKSRLRLEDGNRTILANRAVEQGWTKVEGERSAPGD